MRLERLFSEAMHPNMSKAATEIKDEIAKSLTAAGLTFMPKRGIEQYRNNNGITQGILVGTAIFAGATHKIVLDLYNHIVGLAKIEVLNKGTKNEYVYDLPVSRWYSIEEFIKHFQSKSKKSDKWDTMTPSARLFDAIKQHVRYDVTYGPKERPPKPKASDLAFHDDDEFNQEYSYDHGNRHSTKYASDMAEDVKKLLERVWEPINKETVQKVLSNLRLEIYGMHWRRYAEKAGIPVSANIYSYSIITDANGIRVESREAPGMTVNITIPDDLKEKLISLRNSAIQKIAVMALKSS